MMRNKKGWGIAMMIVYMSILLAFLLVATIMVYNLYRYNSVIKDGGKNSDDVPNINETIEDSKQRYKLYENRIKRNAITFAYTYYLPLNESPVKITLEDMIKKDLMNNLVDPKDNSVCTGYAILTLENDKIISTPYLKCNNYVTEGYED